MGVGEALNVNVEVVVTVGEVVIVAVGVTVLDVVGVIVVEADIEGDREGVQG